MTSPQHSTSSIFISHSSKDNDFGIRLTKDLRVLLGDDSKVWYDALGGLIGGDDFLSKIDDELIARDTFLIILSPDAVKSSWVNAELKLALNEHYSKQKNIIPVLYQPCTPRRRLDLFHRISFVAPITYYDAFAQLSKALGVIHKGPAPANPHTAALVQQMTPLAVRAFQTQDWAAVIDYTEQMLKKAPGAVSAHIYHLQGKAFFSTGQLPEAHEALRKALALVSDPHQRMLVMRDYAAVLNRQQRWTELLNFAQEASRLDPNDPWWLIVQVNAQKKILEATLASLPAPVVIPSPPPKPVVTPSPPPKPVLPRVGSYQLERSLGKYSMGSSMLWELFEGTSFDQPPKKVLVKVLYPPFSGRNRTRFMNEAGRLSQLTIPHMLPVLDCGIDTEDKPYLVMDARNLASLPPFSLREEHPLKKMVPLATIKKYVVLLAEGLQAAHDRHMVHGNLKPESILVGANQDLLLTDFTIPVIDEQHQRLMGTSPYAAPEQMEGKLYAASDQYALGVMVYEWLMGFQLSRDTLQNIEMWSSTSSVLSSPLRMRFHDFPLAIEVILVKALAHDPGRRFARVDDFAQSLLQNRIVP
jgi:serine/threonine protein kinase